MLDQREMLRLLALVNAIQICMSHSLAATARNWLRTEWQIHTSPHSDPCMQYVHSTWNKSCTSNGTRPKFEGCRAIWAHRIAVHQNQNCLDPTLPDLTGCGANRTCRADRWYECLVRNVDASFCSALYSYTPFDVWDSQECEKAWNHPGATEGVEIECARWIAAYGCETMHCGCVTIDHTTLDRVSTLRCIMYPRSWPHVDVATMILVLVVWCSLIVASQNSATPQLLPLAW